MAGYSRPFSKHELRQMRRSKQRLFVWGAVAVLLAIAFMVGVIYMLYAGSTH